MSYSSEVLADSPLTYLRHGDTAGSPTAADSSGNSRPGTSTSVVFGQTGLIADTDTAADYANARTVVPNGAWMAPSSFTIEAWIKPDTLGERSIANRWNATTGSRPWLFGTNSSSQIRFVTSTGGTVVGSTLSTGTTYHVAAVYTGGTASIYVNGVLDVTGSCTAPATSSAPLHVGGIFTNTWLFPFDGVIDELAFYGSALSGARVAAHYAAGTSGVTAVTMVGTLPAPTGTSTVQTGSQVTATATLAMPTGTADVQTGSSITATGTLPPPTSTFDVALGDASFATLDGTLLQPAASFDLTFRADATLSGALPSPSGSITLTAAHTVTLDGAIRAPSGAFSLSVDGTLTVALDGALPMPTGLVDLDNAPPTSVGPERGRARTGYGIANWDPPVVQPPATVAPVYARIAAHAYTSVTMNGTRPVLNEFATADKTRHRDRIVIAGRDVTYYRGVATPLPKFGLVSPLLYGSGTLELPQVAACFETPGRGSLSWLRPGAPVLVQRVDPNTNTIIATDYKGIVLDFATNGRALTVTLGGDALGRASLRDKQPPIFKRRNDIGWWWWNALAGPDGLYRPFGKVGGPTTGINVYDTGGAGYVTYLNELAAKGVNLAGAQWTCDPIESGPNAGTYRVHRKNLETITGTVYLDDAHTVASLQADVAEQPNRIFGTGVTPRGERAKFGVYPVLAEKQRARFPNYLDPRPIEQGDTNADTDTGGGVTALLHRLSVTGYLSADAFAGGYDNDVTAAVRDLQDDAGLPETGKVNQVTWDALFDVDVVGYSTRGSRIEPIAQLPKVRRVRRNASGQVIGRGLFYNPQALPIDRTFDFGTGVTRGQMREWSRSQLHQERHWTGTITFELGALIDGEHTPGDPLTAADLIPARALRPGHNLWLPLFDGGTLVHVSGVDVNSAQQVVVAVDTRARDTMTVWEVIARNQDNKRNPARAWIRDHRSSSGIKDAVTEFDEIGGTVTDTDLDAGWTVFPVVAGQEGTIARLRMRLDKPAEYVVAVFGRRIAPKRLAGVIGNPLEHAGAKRWSDPDRLDKLVGDRVLLYVAGDDQAPCGYYPGTKETETYTPQVPNPDYNVDVAPDNPAYNNQETLNEQIPNPNYNPADPDNDQEFIDKVITEQKTPVTGRWVDDSGFGYRTFDQSCVLWVAVYVRRPRTLQGGRIMWPQLESGS